MLENEDSIKELESRIDRIEKIMMLQKHFSAEKDNRELFSGRELLWLMLIAKDLKRLDLTGNLWDVVETATVMVDNLMTLPLDLLKPSSRSLVRSVFGGK